MESTSWIAPLVDQLVFISILHASGIYAAFPHHSRVAMVFHAARNLILSRSVWASAGCRRQHHGDRLSVVADDLFVVVGEVFEQDGRVVVLALAGALARCVHQRQIASDVTQSSYPCPAGSAVELYSIIDGGHTWPGNPFVVSPVPLVGGTTTSISADRIMGDFCRAHPLEGSLRR
ncbi:hypothetical protein ABZ552_06460 [Nocardia sp. NPDC019219]|uniref:hypothetical protein n=1 Tax=Nocardia sp. NPDC019219 TaxID=3154590 RepID=UPI0033D1328B